MKEIKKVKYDNMKCLATEDYAVCPYCGYENYIEPDDYLGQDEEEFEICGECEKTFVHEINYRITFTSEPLENYYLRERKWRLERIKYYKEQIKQNNDDSLMKEMHTDYVKIAKKELRDFEEEMLEMMEVED